MLNETIITDEESLIESQNTSNYKKVVTSRKTEFSSIREEGKTDNEIMLLK